MAPPVHVFVASQARDAVNENRGAVQGFITPTYVIEPAAGLTRSLMAFLIEVYVEDEAPNTKGGMDKRMVLRLVPRLAPVKVAVLRLSPPRRREPHGPRSGRRVA
jgi:glycyl-tRNA synthetase (class II)